MDSKNIYIAVHNTSYHASWQGEEHDGWVYIGDGKDFDAIQAQRIVSSFFDEERIYLSVTRHQGFELSTSKAGWVLQKHIEDGAWLVNKTFKRVTMQQRARQRERALFVLTCFSTVFKWLVPDATATTYPSAHAANRSRSSSRFHFQTHKSASHALQQT